MLTLTFSPWDKLTKIRLQNRSGLQIDLLANGTMGSIEQGDVLLNQFRGIPPEGAPFRLWLRSSDQFLSLLNPARVTAFEKIDDLRALWQGKQESWRWRVMLELDPICAAWTWHAEIAQDGLQKRPVEIVMAQDIGLTGLDHARVNENYNSHYIDHTVLHHPQWGPVLCARQNLPQGDGFHPWLAASCPTGAVAFATDGLDVFGLSQRTNGHPRLIQDATLPSHRRQGESACAALQSRKVQLAPGRNATFRFHVTYCPDHPATTGEGDLEDLSAGRAPVWPNIQASPVARSIWDEPDLIHGEDWEASDWDRWFPCRREEEWIQGRLASFFTPEGVHVATKAKESIVERSHGQILLGSNDLLPEEKAFGTTTYAPGVFNAQTYCGNPDFARLLSVVRDPLQRLRASGQRVWIWLDDSWRLLGTPTAFAMGLDRVEWWYQFPGSLLRIVSRVEADPSAVILECRVEEGAPLRWLVTHQLCLGTTDLDQGGSIAIDPDRAEAILTPDPETQDAQRHPERRYRIAATPLDAVARLGGDAAIWLDRQSRQSPFLVLETHEVRELSVKIDAATAATPTSTPQSICGPSPSTWRIDSPSPALATLAEILPWFRHNARLHLASPHGLEQYGGGAWGVRDVCQGPVEWLLGEQRYAEVREILRTVFSHQYASDGLWPQWFMLGSYADIQQRHCHGDIAFWPLKALCDYAEAANDPGVLEMTAPFLDEDGGPLSPRPLLEHVDEVIRRYPERCAGNTSLVAYGDGDWDDTLQPAQPQMRREMVSSWTVQLAYQTFGQLATLLERAGHHTRADHITELRGRIREDFHRHLMPDGIATGFALQRASGFEPLLHPRDKISGIQYRLLPMTRGILSGIFDPRQARAHATLIREQLRFPDGVRLMNRPVSYTGGISRMFQRAETSAYFGREVALQYAHAHLRYAEAMARIGDADEAWWALQIVNPTGLSSRLPNAAPRQANVYFSSSDGDYADRYEALEHFEELRDGRRTVKSGWRLYSSGPGLYLHKVRSCLFGIREHYDQIVFDPMLPSALSSSQIHMNYEGKDVCVLYSTRYKSPILINGQKPDMATPLANPYRNGGTSLDRREFLRRLDQEVNIVEIALRPPS